MSMTASPPPAAAPPADWRVRARGWLGELRVPLVLTAVAFCVLALFAGHRFWHQSKAPQFVYQAMAFLHGKLELGVRPPNNEDWVFLHGKWYSSFPAFPALLMVPLVAINGYQLNDTSFTVIIAALNLLFFYLALRSLSRAGDSNRTERENLILAGLLGFGTLYFYCAIRGEVWFTAEVMGVGLTALYVLFAHRGRNPALAGLFFSAGTLTRAPIMFSVVFILCEIFAPSGRPGELFAKVERERRKQQLVALGQFVMGALPLALWHMWMNWARFGSVTDFGHDHLYNNRVNADIARWGMFNLHYLTRNIASAFLLLPRWAHGAASGLSYNPHGLSLLLTTPLFALALFPAASKGHKDRVYWALALAAAAVLYPWFFDRGPDPRSPFAAPTFGASGYLIFGLVAGRLLWLMRTANAPRAATSKAAGPAEAEPPRLQFALALTVAVMALPGLFYQNDGYIQFGFRFSLDWAPYLFLLLAAGRRPMRGLFWALASVGLAVNAWGALAFRGYSDMFR